MRLRSMLPLAVLAALALCQYVGAADEDAVRERTRAIREVAERLANARAEGREEEVRALEEKLQGLVAELGEAAAREPRASGRPIPRPRPPDMVDFHDRMAEVTGEIGRAAAEGRAEDAEALQAELQELIRRFVRSVRASEPVPHPEPGPMPGPEAEELRHRISELAHRAADLRAEGREDEAHAAMAEIEELTRALAEHAAASGRHGEPFVPDSRFVTMLGLGPRAWEDAPHIVRTSPDTSLDLGSLAEDLRIMGHVIRASLGPAPGDAERGRGPAFPGVFRPYNVACTFIEGYGTLYTVDVPFALRETPAEGEPEPGPEAESLWEQTRREMHTGHWTDVTVPGWRGPEAEDAALTEALVDRLVEVLREATNIRGLAPDDRITIAARGGAGPGVFAGPETFMGRGVGIRLKSGDSHMTVLGEPSAGTGMGAPPDGSAMTVAARKADVDALAAGKLTPEEFRRKVTVLIY
jgi:hypothetical protein